MKKKSQNQVDTVIAASDSVSPRKINFGNSCQKITQKQISKQIYVFWFCPDLLDFLTFAKIFCHRLQTSSSKLNSIVIFIHPKNRKCLFKMKFAAQTTFEHAQFNGDGQILFLGLETSFFYKFGLKNQNYFLKMKGFTDNN